MLGIIFALEEWIRLCWNINYLSLFPEDFLKPYNKQHYLVKSANFLNTLPLFQKMSQFVYQYLRCFF